jgi:hypothetical protein
LSDWKEVYMEDRREARLIPTRRGVEIRCPWNSKGHLGIVLKRPNVLEFKCKEGFVILEVEKANDALARRSQ